MYCPFCYHAYRSNNIKPGFCVYCGERLDNVELLDSLKEVQLEHAFNETNEIFSSRNKETKVDEGIIYKFSPIEEEKLVEVIEVENAEMEAVQEDEVVEDVAEATDDITYETESENEEGEKLENTSDALNTETEDNVSKPEVIIIEDVPEIEDVACEEVTDNVSDESDEEDFVIAVNIDEVPEEEVSEDNISLEIEDTAEDTEINEEIESEDTIEETVAEDETFEVSENAAENNIPEVVVIEGIPDVEEAEEVSETEEDTEAQELETENIAEAETIPDLDIKAEIPEEIKNEEIVAAAVVNSAFTEAVAKNKKEKKITEEKPKREPKEKSKKVEKAEKVPKEKAPKKVKDRLPEKKNKTIKAELNEKTVPEKKSKKNIAVVIIAAILVLAAAGVCIAYFSLSGKDKEIVPNDGATTTKPIITRPIATVDETEPSLVYDSIVGESSLDNVQLSELQTALDSKSEEININVKLVFTKGDSEAEAKNNVETQCGKDGILIVINEDKSTGSVAACGKGESYLPEGAKKAVTSVINDNLSKKDSYNACMGALAALPINADEAKLYSYAAVADSQQVVYADSKNKELVLIDWSADKPQKLFTAKEVYFGKDGVTSSPSENKSATPLGTFKLGFAFSDEKLTTGLDTVKIESGMVWVDDSNSQYYNTLQKGTQYNSKWSSSENISAIFSRNEYYASILIEHNGDGYTKGEAGKGSAIFLTGKESNLTKSYGDVIISASDMKTLLSVLEESKNPHIVIS